MSFSLKNSLTDKKDIIKTINKHANKTVSDIHQTRGSYPFSHISKEQQIGLAEY